MRERLRRGLERLSRDLSWVAPLFAALISIAATLSALHSLTFAAFARDQGIFQYVAWAIRSGQRAYHDFHEINGPLPHAWNVLLLAVGGEDEHVFRSIDTAFVVMVYAAAALTIPRWVGLVLPRPALAAWALAGVAVLGAQFARYDWWHANQREGFYAALVLGSLALQAAAHRTRNARHALWLFGLSAATTSLTWFGKPPCAIFSLLQVGVLVLDRANVCVTLRRVAGASAVGAFASGAVMLAFAASAGDVIEGLRFLAKVPLLHHTIWNRSIVDSYRAWDNGPRLDWAFVTSAGFIAAYVLLRLPRVSLLALILPVGGFVVFAGQGKGFPYHLQMVTLGTSVMHLVILAGLAKRGQERVDAVAVVATLAAITLGFKCREDSRLSPAGRSDWAVIGATKELRSGRAYYDRFEWGDYFTADLHEASKYVAAHTRPDERIQTYGLDPFFLFLAKRHTATPVIYNFELNIDPALEGGSGAKLSREQRAELMALRNATERAMLESVQASPPAAFVFFDKAPFGHPANGEADFAEHCPDVYRWLDERYAPTTRIGTVRIRLRNDVAAREGGKGEER